MSETTHDSAVAMSAPPSSDEGLTPAQRAQKYGLSQSGARPSLPQYIRELWDRRHFISAFASAKLTAQYSQAKLGQLWQVATPLLNALVYYFIFGVLIGTRDGIKDFVLFLVTGVFIFTFTQNSVMAGTRSIAGNLGLVRALHFPRACLPVSFCIMQLQQLLFSMGVLVLIMLAKGQMPMWSWLLAVPVLALQFVFNTGLAMIMARLGSKTPDLAQLMPFIMRTWLYASGVMFSIDNIANKADIPGWVQPVLEYNPAAIFIDLMRYSLIESFTDDRLPAHLWAGAGWALLLGVVGFVYFWKAEERYGRG
ncbi:ABC transporter permease [Streptomyces sp. NPDC050636]|uniref:ABC transporter permease n=1 Tax=Streptomyces sp. NPDC050636 TaxID=3154510 RepID=UPI0034475157